MDCLICFERINLQEINRLRNCSHVFCKSCISEYFRSTCNSNIDSMRCPQDACKAIITINDLRNNPYIDVFEDFCSNFDPYLHKIDSIIIEINKFKDSLTYITIKPKYDNIINKLSLLKSIINSSEYYPIDDEENMNKMYISIYSMLNTLVETDSRILEASEFLYLYLYIEFICNH